MPRLQLTFHGAPGAAAHHLSVDGMTPAGPNLSHWPGNRTPAHWKHDLSTGIALNFARADAAEQDRFLDGAEQVLNDHYDTDGFLSLLAILRTDVALPREELLLAAAACGDFGCYVTWRAFAIDRIVRDLATPASPVAHTFAPFTGPERSLQRYRWLIGHAAALLDDPTPFTPVYQAELDQVRAELDGARRRRGIALTVHATLGFTAITTDGPRHRMTLNSVARAFRVLHVQRDQNEHRYRYHDRTESWFELQSIPVPPRRDLRPLCARLGVLEPPHDGGRWCTDPPDAPIPELWFGEPSEQEYGEVTRRLLPSRLAPAAVERECCTFFAEQPAS